VLQKAVGHKSVILIGASEDARLIAAGAAVLDANPPQRWRAIHVPGSRNVDPARYAARSCLSIRRPRWSSTAQGLAVALRTTPPGGLFAWASRTFIW